MNIDTFKDNIKEYIDFSHENSNLELEAILKPTYSEPINLDDFTRLMRRLNPLSIKKTQVETLDIIYEYQPGKQSNIRISIIGKQNIKRYCETNRLDSIDDRYVKFLRKQRVKVTQDTENGSEEVFLKPIDIDDYNIRINLKSEDYLSRNHKNVIDVLDNKTWNNKRKFFRYKSRYSFLLPNKQFTCDLTIVKTSDVKIIDSDQKKIRKFIYTKNIQESNVFKNDQNYEIELEYVGNKSTKTPLLDSDSVMNEMFKYIGFILQSHQKSFYLSSKKDRKTFRDEYTSLLGLSKYKGFQGPNPITIEQKHIQKRSYIEYKNELVNIRRNYSVTDKADGERNCLVVLEDGRMFMINRKHFIRYLGVSCNYSNTIIDGEYLDKDKEGNNISLFMAFDIYVLNGTKVTERIFQRNSLDISRNVGEQSRYEILQDMNSKLELEKEDDNPFQFLVKKFYFGDDHMYDDTTYKQISDLEILLHEEQTKDPIDQDNIDRLNEQLNILYSDSEIFKKSKLVYEKEYIYNIDGLIFTPTNLSVGEDKINNTKNFNGRWFMNFKWKPPEENTIDFLIYFEKDPENLDRDDIGYININQKVVPYKTAILNVGYDPQVHTKYNACRVLNENLVFKNGYYPTKFYPTNPYNNKINKCKIPLINGNTLCSDGSIITDGSIIEFKYNDFKDDFIWTPLRKRDILTPNDFLTASNVWNSINNPVTTNMIKGDDKSINNHNLMANEDAYYINIKKRSNLLTKPMADLHSLIKKMFIKSNVEPNTNLIDISAGRLGDLNHWIDSNLSSVVAIDISKDNFDNINNGACIRILNRQSVESSIPLLNNILLVWADSSKDLTKLDSGLDDLNNYYLNILFGRIGKQNISSKKLKLFYGMAKKGFETVSCQFSIHYFFKNQESLNNLLSNVSILLKEGGKFIATCLDGKEVFDRLRVNPILEGLVNGETVWKITKKYTEIAFPDNETSLGMEIDVYVESINQTLTEYLVNFDYLIKEARKFNLEIVEKKNFGDIYNLIESNTTYGDIDKLNDQLKEYSFMNSTITFKKI